MSDNNDKNIDAEEEAVYEALERSFKKRGLGRGLNALFEDEEGDYPSGAEAQQESSGPGRKMIDIAKIRPGEFQPRKTFDDAALKELSESVKKHGLLQPILVRESEGEFEIVAGERRWRAAQKAGLHEVPIILRDFTDREALEIGLVENLQRVDLNPMDEANALEQLLSDFGYTQEEAAKAVGKSRPYVANMVRLINLPEEVQKFIVAGELTAGHARTLVTADDPVAMAKQIIGSGLSVREAEKLSGKKSTTPKKSKSPAAKDINTVALEKEVSDKLGLNVSIDMKDKSAGRVVISFRDLDQLDEVLHRLSIAPKSHY
ncbi:MAG: chromosome partitioning protein ParB [Micavibrio sp.]|nr:chromosome partitioning protein ParB [Micavibrio sp.]